MTPLVPTTAATNLRRQSDALHAIADRLDAGEVSVDDATAEAAVILRTSPEQVERLLAATAAAAKGGR